MPNYQYQRGTRFEHKVTDILISLGYVVVRAAGSKGDSKADLIAFHPDAPIMLIQCKISGTISKAEWDRVLEVASWYDDCVPVLASNGPKGRGVTFLQILDEKVPYARSQPATAYNPAQPPRVRL